MRNYAKKVGLEEGRAEGRAEGLAEGEKNKAIEMARTMILDNVSINLIAKYTGLSEEEIKKL